MVSTLARILDVGFKRIQFTPDLMPSDITGTNVLEEDEQGKRHFRFVEGPIFTNILLADEINRTPPKTIKVNYPTLDEEEQILASTTRGERPEVRKVLSGRAILNLQKLVRSVAVSEYIIKYVSKLVRATRPKDPSAPKFVRELVDWGAGPRAGQFLIHGGKALAAMEGRFSVAIEDVQKVAVPVLRHRVSTNFQAQAEGMTNEDMIERLLAEIPTPEIPKFQT
jgi:MoxR-like ATPase